MSHIETFTVKFQIQENNPKAIKIRKSMEMYPGTRKMFKSATRLDSDDFLSFLKFLNAAPHCEKAKFYDVQAKAGVLLYGQVKIKY